MDQQTKDKLAAIGRQDLIDIFEIKESGHAGILPGGGIVDCRLHPNAVPIPPNNPFLDISPEKARRDAKGFHKR